MIEHIKNRLEILKPEIIKWINSRMTGYLLYSKSGFNDDICIASSISIKERELSVYLYSRDNIDDLIQDLLTKFEGKIQ